MVCDPTLGYRVQLDFTNKPNIGTVFTKQYGMLLSLIIN